MHSNCILDSVANLLVRHMVFVGNVQKSPIASQGLGSWSRFLLSRSSSHGHKGRWIRWSSASAYPFEASEMFLSLHIIFSLERAAVVLAILERISGFDPSLQMIAPRYLKFTTSSSLWHFILISLWKPFGLFVIIFVLSGPISILYLVVVVSRRSTRTPASSSSSAFTTMSSAKWKLVISRPPMLTLPSWSSNASHMILSRKIVKRVGESRHPCRIPVVVLNHPSVLPLNRTALWALSYRFSMARMMLTLMLYISSWLPIMLRAIPCQRPSWSL